MYLKVALKALGFDVKKADVLKILKDYDREGTGKINYDDFTEVGMYEFVWIFKIKSLFFNLSTNIFINAQKKTAIKRSLH